VESDAQLEPVVALMIVHICSMLAKIHLHCRRLKVTQSYNVHDQVRAQSARTLYFHSNNPVNLLSLRLGYFAGLAINAPSLARVQLEHGASPSPSHF
jgi:hypothetical protein